MLSNEIFSNLGVYQSKGKIMKNRTWLWLFIILAVISIVFLLKIVSIEGFLGLCAIWIIGFFLYMVGPETVSEITIWKASIKRDVTAARGIRDEIEKISKDLKSVIKITAENSYIMASSSFLAMGGDQKAKIRLEKNLNALIDFVEPDKDTQDIWWKELQSSTFPNRENN